MTTLTPLQYLQRELNLLKHSDEWIALTTSDKDTLKRWAAEEMAVLGIA